jgi:hypothetical protein
MAMLFLAIIIVAVLLSEASSNVIPRKLWQTYDPLPLTNKHIAHIQSSWLRHNRGLVVHLFNDSACDSFVCNSSRFDAALCTAYRGMPLNVMRADIWRYAVMAAEGGIYADIDVECRAPIEHWIGNASCQLIVSPGSANEMQQWIIAAVPQHPVLLRVLENIARRAAELAVNTSYEHFVHDHTGPYIWSYTIYSALARFTGARVPSITERFSSSSSSSAEYNFVERIEALLRVSPIARRNRDELGLCILPEDDLRTRYVAHHFGSQRFGDYKSWTRIRSARFGVGTEAYHCRTCEDGTRRT